MSSNHPYRKPQDDFSSHHDMYTDSQRMYHRESSAYRSRIRSATPERSALSPSDLSVIPPGKALNFLHSCGLDAEDLQTLAELPEHLMTAETLPELLTEIKRKKAANASSSRSNTLQSSSSSRSWEDRSHTPLVEYPLDLPVHQSYPHHRDSSQNWEDRWKSDQPTRAYSSSGTNYVVEYNHLKEKDDYFDQPSYTTESSRQKSPMDSQSYSTYSRDISQPSYLSSRDVGQPSHLSSREIRIPSLLSSLDVGQTSQLSSRDIGIPSLLSGIDVGQRSHLSSRDVGLPSLLTGRNISQVSQPSSRDIIQSSRMSSKDTSQHSYLTSRDISQPSHQSNRNISQSSHLSSRNISQPSHLSSRNINQPSHLSSRNVSQPSDLSRRNISQPSHLSSRNISQPSNLSSRNISQPSHLSSRDVDQPSHYRRTENVHRVPTRKEASDFHGRTPPVFPYACVLCDITVLSNKDWSVHIKGAQHANSQLSLVEQYPEWDQTIRSARRNESLSEKPQSRTTQERGGTSGSRNGSSSKRTRLSGSKSKSSDSKNSHNVSKITEKDKCKVVCVKFEVDEVDKSYLEKLLGQFGAILKIIMFPRMAFAEMGSPDQAADIVKYFLHNPLRLKGHLLEFSLSAACSFIENSHVVSFMPLPAGEGIHSELTAIARRFGSVKHSLFLPNRGYVEMASVEEAKKLVEHYATNSLKLKGKTIQVSFSAEYQALSDKNDDKQESSSTNKRRRSVSPQRRSQHSRKHSPSPKRRSSAEKSGSRRRSSSRKQDERKCSKEKSGESSRRSSRSCSKKSPPKDQSKQTDESAEQKTEDKKDQSDAMCDDSDLEGVAVIAEDCDELNSEDEEFIEIDHEDDLDSSAALTDQEVSEDMQNLEESDDNAIPSNTRMHSESDPNATTLEGSGDCKKTQEQNQELLNDKTVETVVDGESECNEVKELQQNQEVPTDKTGEIKNAPVEDKKTQELHQNEEESVDKTAESADGSSECKEAQQLQQNQDVQKDKSVETSTKSSECEEPKEPQTKQQTQQDTTVNPSYESSEHKEAEQLQHNQELQEDNSEEMNQDASDFPGTLENCITLDEFKDDMMEEDKPISTSSTEETYGKVLEVKGFPLAKKYTEADLMNIGKKCGEVAGCCLVRNNRKVEKALIEMVNAVDASKLEAESKKQNFKLGGKILKITVSDKYSQLKERVNTETESEKAEEKKPVEVKELSQSATSCEEMPAEMESSEPLSDEPQKDTGVDTTEQTSSNEDVTSGENQNNEPKTQIDSDPLSSQTQTQNVKESSDDNQDENSKEDERQISASDEGTETPMESSDSVSAAPTHLDHAVGTEFVRPVVGYFCSLCSVIYASEEEAKDDHCRTVLHHQKLQERMEQNSSK